MPVKKKRIPGMLRGNFWPVSEDTDTDALEQVELTVRYGTLPRGLSGTYVRNGPNNSFDLKDGQAYHFFDGDGMLHQISLEDGRATVMPSAADMIPHVTMTDMIPCAHHGYDALYSPGVSAVMMSCVHHD